MAARRGLGQLLRSRPRTIRAALLLLIAATFVPTFTVVLLASIAHYRSQRAGEVRAQAEIARSVAGGFDWLIQDLVRTQYAVGVSIAAHGHTASEIQLELEAVVADNGSFRALSWAYEDGRITASTDARLVGASVYARDYFQQIVRGAPWAVSALLRSLADAAPVFVVGRRIDVPGERPGVVIGTVDPDRLARIFGTRTGGDVTAILDPAGVLVASHPRLPDMSWEARHLTVDHPFVHEAIAGREATGIHASPLWEAGRIGAIVPVPSSRGWVAYASRPLAEAMAPVWRGVAIRGTAALALGLAALAAAVVLSRRIARPLMELEAHATDVARGQRVVAVIRGPVEVERVARALNEMSEALSVRRDELEAANRQLAISEERFRMLAENARDMIYRYRVTPEPAFEYVSASATRIVGFTPEEHYSNPRLELEIVHPDDRWKLDRLLQGADGQEPTLLRWRSKDGRTVWTEHQVTFVRDAEGRVSALEGFARDVTDRVEAQAQLERARVEAEGAMRTALEYGAERDAIFATAPVGLIHVEGNDRVPRLNAAAREILGLSASFAQPLSEYLRTVRVSHPEKGVIPPDQLPVSRAMRGESPRDELMRIEPLPGHPGRACWLSVSAAPVRGPAGEVLAAVVSFVDVGTVRELQEERETLMQMVSHDLRTPLQVIRLQGQVLHRRRNDADAVVRGADAILASADRMQRLIEDIVDAARLEAGHLALRVEPVDLAAFLIELKERLAGALAVERVRISVTPDLPFVLADPARLEQVVVNLVTNALKYSVADSDVQVALTHTGDRLELSVRDRGSGIAADELPRLFDRYYRARNATATDGLGLGLFITRKLVDAHGWDMRVESELGRGSTFTVVVPAGPASRGSAVERNSAVRR